MSAKEAFKSYVRAYDSHHLKNIFDISTIDLDKVALSYGFKVPPAVDLRVSAKKAEKLEKMRGGMGYYRNANSRNFRNLRKDMIFKQPKKQDGRQFSR